MKVHFLLPLLVLAACADLAEEPGQTPTGTAAAAEAPAPVTAVAAPPPPAAARTVEQFDTTTAEDRAAAKATPASSGETRLGTTIASLGSPTDPGIWLETPLVSAVTMGRIDYKGTSVALELRPNGKPAGSGSQISLAAMRLLGVALTDLPEITVYRN